MFCNWNWGDNNLYLTFTLDFLSCMDGCAQWNTNNTETCVGVIWVSGDYGPDGLSGGCQCYYKWDMIGAGYSFNGGYAGQLEKFPEVHRSHFTLTLLIYQITTSTTSSVSTSNATSIPRISSSSTSTLSNSPSSGLSHGVIGGLVGGILGGFALLGVGVALLLVRRHKVSRVPRASEVAYTTLGYPVVDDPPGGRLAIE